MGDKEIRHEGLQLDFGKNYLKVGLMSEQGRWVSSVREK